MTRANLDKKPRVTPADNRTASSLQFETIMAEYKVCRDLISKNRDIQSQLSNMAITTFGISLTVVVVIFRENINAIGVLLIFPILFFTIAFLQLWHERIIFLNAIYIDGKLRPKLDSLISKLAKENVSTLGYEVFLQKSNWMDGFLKTWLGLLTRAGISGLFGIIYLILYLYINLESKGGENYELFLFYTNIMFLLVLLLISIFITYSKFTYFDSVKKQRG